MRILYVLSRFPNLTETFIHREILAMKQKGHDLVLASFFPPKNPASPEDPVVRELAGVAVRLGLLDWFKGAFAFIAFAIFRRGFAKKMGLFGLVRDCIKNPKAGLKSLMVLPFGIALSFLAEKHDAEVIHAHFASYPALGAMAASCASGIPFGFTCHAHDLYLDIPFFRAKQNSAAYVIYSSRYLKNYACEKYALPQNIKGEVIYNGLDFENPVTDIYPQTDCFRVLAIGRLIHMKGFALLPDIAKAMHEKLDACVEFHVVGQGPMSVGIKKRAEALGVLDRFIFHGKLDPEQINPLWETAGALIALSLQAGCDHWDNIPTVIMEAFFHHVPVVASDIAGIPEMLGDGKFGLLVPEGDVEGFADALIKIYRDGALAKKLTQDAMSHGKLHFNANQNATMLTAVMKTAKEKKP